MSYDRLRDYLQYLAVNSATLGYRASQGIVRPNEIRSLTPGKRMGLQVADAVAGSFHYALEPSQYGGFTEDIYARLLLPRCYRYKDNIWDFGIKLWPQTADADRQHGNILKGWEK